MQQIGPLARFSGIELGVGFSGLLLELEFLGTVVPVGNFLGEAFFHRRLGLGNQGELLPFDFIEVPRHDVGNGVGLRLLFEPTVDPPAFGPVENGGGIGLAFRQGPIVEIRGVLNVPGSTMAILLNIQHALGDDPTLAGTGQAGVLDGVLEIEQHSGLCSGVALVHQYRATFQQVSVALQRQVDDGIEQRMAGADKGGRRLPLRCHQGLIESDALVARQHGFAEADEAVTVAHRGGHMAEFIASRFALLGRPPEPLERFEEEGFDVMGLQTPGIGALHVLADTLYPARVHGIVNQRALFKQPLKMAAVERGVEYRGQERLDLGALAVTDGLDQQLTQGFALKLEFAEHVEYLSPQGLPGLFDLFQQFEINIALAGLLGHQVPQMADFGLPDTVNTTEALFQAVGVPGQVVVDHEMRALEVDPLAGGVGSQQHLHFGVVPEGFLYLQPFLTPDPTMDQHYGVLAAQ